MRNKTKDTTLPLGTISEGTLCPEDIIPALLDALDGLRLASEDRKAVWRLAAEWNSHDPETDLSAVELDDFDPQEILADLEDLASRYTPAFCYYGTLEGDGACFGVWISWDELRLCSQTGDIVAQSRETASPDAEFALEVSDHGNPTLYYRNGSRSPWREVWAVV